MNENIDLTEILKDCPVGTTLYSVDNGYVEFLRVDTEIGIYHIVVKIKYTGALDYYTKEGKANNFNDSECCLFPSKDQRDWSKFTAPWLKKERDTISETDGYKFIEPRFKVGDWVTIKQSKFYQIKNITEKEYTLVGCDGSVIIRPIQDVDRLASAFTIQNAKDGDVLAANECYVVFKEIDGLNIKCYCTYHYLGFKPGLYRDTVQNKNAFLPATKEQHDAMMKAINDAGYKWNAKTKTLEELIKPKFDPNTLQPFDKVIARNFNDQIWHADIFSHVETDEDGSYYNVIKDDSYLMVIPYNNETKHLAGTTDEAPEYYRYWEE